MSQVSGTTGEQEDSGVAPPLQSGNLRLPSLKYWRTRRGVTQKHLAEMTGLDYRQLSKIEAGTRGCKPSMAQMLAEELGVELADLRALQPDQQPGPDKPRVPSRNLQRAYMKTLLSREVGSAYSVMGEEELERHCERLPLEAVLEVVSGRKREMEVVREMLAGADVPGEVRLFLEEVLRAYPDQDIRLLAAARIRTGSGEGHERLTLAMRELL